MASSPTHNETSTLCVARPDSIHGMVTLLDLEAELIKGCLELADGRRVPFVSIVSVGRSQAPQDAMPVLRGKIRDSYGSVLRDTGCSSVIVKQQLV